MLDDVPITHSSRNIHDISQASKLTFLKACPQGKLSENLLALTHFWLAL
jgi:hypothetical protein